MITRAVTLWMSNGANPLWLALLVVVLCVHRAWASRWVIEDYVHGAGLKESWRLLDSHSRAASAARRRRPGMPCCASRLAGLA